MYDTTITFRTNSKTKSTAQKVFADLGMDLSTALNVFLNKAARTKSIPFDVSLDKEPNKETLAAIDEIYNHPELTEGPYITKEEILEALHA
ncbi:type II toxin-antitoxin system RelB/DinJ family antitoxin [Candidatus Saccharibacteria bacterium]|nr:type II toxin-antitoxin system RelB/DinJ family antitoxin [Candidatus Saccharibacteria bacterium]